MQQAWLEDKVGRRPEHEVNLLRVGRACPVDVEQGRGDNIGGGLSPGEGWIITVKELV